MMGPSPQCYIHVPSFIEICPLVPEKKIFEGFIPYARGNHLGHVSQIPQFSFPPTNGSSTQNLTLIRRVVSENMFEHCGLKNDGLTPEYVFT